MPGMGWGSTPQGRLGGFTAVQATTWHATRQAQARLHPKSPGEPQPHPW